jgi:hypothetical protein
MYPGPPIQRVFVSQVISSREYRHWVQDMSLTQDHEDVEMKSESKKRSALDGELESEPDPKRLRRSTTGSFARSGSFLSGK